MRTGGTVRRSYVGLVLILGLALPLAVPSPALAIGPAFVQGTSVQTTGTTGTVTSLSATFPGSVSTGDTIIVAVAGFPGQFGGVLPSSVTDSNSNTYVEAVGFPTIASGSESSIGIWYASNVAGGSGLQVTATFAQSATIAIAIQEYSGLGSNVSVFQTAVASGASTFATTCQPIETNQSSEVLFAATTFDDSTNRTSAVPGTGYTLRESLLDSDGTHQAIVTQDEGTAGILPPGYYPTSLTVAPSSSWHLVAAGFGAAVVATNTPLPTTTGTPVTGCDSGSTATTTVTATTGPTQTMSPTPSVTATASSTTATTTPSNSVTSTGTATGIASTTVTMTVTPTATETATATATLTPGPTTETPTPPARILLPVVDNEAPA